MAYVPIIVWINAHPNYATPLQEKRPKEDRCYGEQNMHVGLISGKNNASW